MNHYTDADVEAGGEAVREKSWPHEWLGNDPEIIANDVLDAVAPAIAARALRGAADWLEDDNYVLVPDQLRGRADEIEAGQS